MASLPQSECDALWGHGLYHSDGKGSKAEQEMGDIFLILTFNSAVGPRAPF